MEAEIRVKQPQAKKMTGAPGWERQGRIFPKTLERMQPRQHLDFRLVAFRSAREYISVVRNQRCMAICSQMPQETDSPRITKLMEELCVWTSRKAAREGTIWGGLCPGRSLSVLSFLLSSPIHSQRDAEAGIRTAIINQNFFFFKYRLHVWLNNWSSIY